MMYRKHFLILVSFLLILAAKTTAQQIYSDISAALRSSIFYETFDNNTNGWITDNSWISGKFNNGYFDIVCKNFKQNTGLTYKIVSLDFSKDFEIETSIKIVKGTGALVFGLTKDFDHYRVEIDSKKNVLIVKDTPSKGKVEKLFSGTVKSITDPLNYNKLTISKFGGTYFISINDQQIKQLQNLNLSGDQIGYSVELNSEISVDYLKISTLKLPSAPVVAERNIDKKEAPGILLPVTSTRTNVTKTPSITWVSPSGVTTSLDTYSARVRANIKSGSELSSVLFFVNGVSRGEADIKTKTDEPGAYVAEKSITLSPGENNVYLVATNFEGSSKSDLRYFNNPTANPPEIIWGVPTTSNAVVNTEMFTLEICLKSPAELVSAKVLVDGVQVTVGKVFQKSVNENCTFTWRPQIILKEGENSIYVIAENIAGSTTSENRIIRFNRAIAEKRLALVIGNSNYSAGSFLKNPVNDANLMEATLKELGFVVIKRINSVRDSMLNSIREFSRKLSDYNVALFYYAGHGIQVDGVNYLIPVNAKLENKDDCKWEAVAVSTVTDEFKKNSANTNIVILDACRNNPYRSWARGGEQGFKALAPINGSIISFSTSEGATAADGDGANGLFTQELVKQMVIPQQIESVFKKTRKEVVDKSKGQQTPTEWSYLTGDFYFKK